MMGSEDVKNNGQGGEIMNSSIENIPTDIALMSEQINLLAEWNKRHIDIDPEQVRKNLETMLSVLKYIKDS